MHSIGLCESRGHCQKWKRTACASDSQKYCTHFWREWINKTNFFDKISLNWKITQYWENHEKKEKKREKRIIFFLLTLLFLIFKWKIGKNSFFWLTASRDYWMFENLSRWNTDRGDNRKSAATGAKDGQFSDVS